MVEERRLAIRVAVGAAPSARGSRRLVQAGAIALAVLTACGMLQCADAAGRARMAQRTEPQVGMAATILAEPASQIPIAIQVGPRDALPANSFIRLRGLPPSVSLSEGHAIGPGSWAIPLFGLATLKANIPAGVSGRSELVVTLVAVDGTLLAEGRTALVVAPAAMQGAAEQQPDPGRASTLVPPSPVP